MIKVFSHSCSSLDLRCESSAYDADLGYFGDVVNRPSLNDNTVFIDMIGG